MTYVVTSGCDGCKYTDCVVVCPVECFHEGETMLCIDPLECIDCGQCVPECPVEAIFHEDMVPENELHMIQFNAEMSKILPSIFTKKPPLAGH